MDQALDHAGGPDAAVGVARGKGVAAAGSGDEVLHVLELWRRRGVRSPPLRQRRRSSSPGRCCAGCGRSGRSGARRWPPSVP